jgi:hypothetical protein
MRKLLFRSLLVLVLVSAGTAWWLFHSLDALVASAIRTYGPQITGVAVKVDSVKIDIAQGNATLHGLEVGNPTGYRTERAISVARVNMSLDIASLTKDIVRINEIVIEQPAVTYEYAPDGSNLDVIERNVKAYIAARSGDKAPSAEPQKRVVIENLYVRGARAKVSADVLQGKVVELPIADLHLRDIGKKSKGATPADVAYQVLGSVAQATGSAAAQLHLGGLADSVRRGAAGALDAVKDWFK